MHVARQLPLLSSFRAFLSLQTEPCTHPPSLSILLPAGVATTELLALSIDLPVLTISYK